MVTAGPGESLTLTQSGIPTGREVFFQVIKAATGAVSIGRTSVGVAERPAGSGIYVATFIVPVEVDLYIIVLDWSTGGSPTPSTSTSEELRVTTSAAQADTGLGEIADYVKTYLGGETFRLLLESPSYGPSFISIAIEVVKSRVMAIEVPTASEGILPKVVLSYLGKLAALELMPATIDIWSTREQSKSVGKDPIETVTYPSRQAMLEDLRELLISQVRAEQQLAISLIPDARLPSSAGGPLIDEEASSRVTRDPRTFPRERHFPYHGGLPVSSMPPEAEVYGP